MVLPLMTTTNTNHNSAVFAYLYLFDPPNFFFGFKKTGVDERRACQRLLLQRTRCPSRFDHIFMTSVYTFAM